MYAYICDNWLEVLGTLVGLVYIYQEIKASIYLWITGIIMPAIYCVVYWQAGLYADMGIQIYYIVAAVYGLLVWKFFRSKSGNTLRIKHLPLRKYPFYIGTFVVAYIVIASLLLFCTDSDVPFFNALDTSIAVVGLILLARKYIEQWIAWMVVDSICVILFIFKGIYFTAGLYALYTILAVYGYYVWKRKMEADE